MRLTILALAAALLGLVAALPAAAQGDVPVVSGGIGIAEQEALKAREQDFNLKLVFTLVEGNYVADVRVTVKDIKNRTVIEHTARGPFLMAKLPPGRYRVRAVFRNKAVMREVRLTERLRTEYLRWPSDPTKDFPLPPAHRKN